MRASLAEKRESLSFVHVFEALTVCLDRSGVKEGPEMCVCEILVLLLLLAV